MGLLLGTSVVEKRQLLCAKNQIFIDEKLRTLWKPSCLLLSGLGLTLTLFCLNIVPQDICVTLLPFFHTSLVTLSQFFIHIAWEVNRALPYKVDTRNLALC